MPTAVYEQARTALEHMSQKEFDQFLPEVLALSARRRAPILSHAESELLVKVNRGVPQETQRRCQTLNTKRRADTLNADELAELIRLNDSIEEMEAERIKALAELAELRQTTLPELMRDLGIQHSIHA